MARNKAGNYTAWESSTGKGKAVPTASGNGLSKARPGAVKPKNQPQKGPALQGAPARKSAVRRGPSGPTLGPIG